MTTRILLFKIVCFICAASSFIVAQTVKFVPAQPQWGDTLQIEFNPGAAFPKTVDVSFLVYLSFENDQIEHHLFKPEKINNVYNSELILDDSTSFIKLFVVDNEKMLIDSTYKLLVYNLQNKPAKGAYAQLAIYFDEEERKEILDKEFRLYPDNYREYQNYWSNLERIHVFEDFSLRDTVKKSLKIIRNKNPKVSADLLYLLAHAHLILKERQKYLFYLNELVNNYPTNPVLLKYLPFFKFGEELPHGEESFTKTKEGEVIQSPLKFQDIYNGWERKLIAQFPYKDATFWIAGEKIDDPTFLPGQLKKIFLSKIINDEKDPRPYFYLAKLYFYRFKDMKKALEYSRLASQKYKSVCKPLYFSPYFKQKYQKEFIRDVKHLESYIVEQQLKNEINPR